MDKRFLTAFSAPEEWDIMGFKLKPFSTRHLLVLTAVDSPFLSTGRFPEPYETIAFLRICSMKRASYDVRPGFLDSLFAFRLQFNTELHLNVCKAISLYIKEYCSPPKLVSKGIRDELVEKPSDIPASLATLTLAMAKMGMTEEEALDAPIGRLSWYALCFSMIEGNRDVRLITTEQEEKAEDDRQSILRHEMEAERRLKTAMTNGKIPKLKIKRTSQ